MSDDTVYRVSYVNGTEIYELYARSVGESGLPGFVEVAELCFDHGRQLVVDPSEERLRQEFADVEVLHVPMQHILKIEEVHRRGTARIRDQQTGENVTALPLRPRPER